MKRVLMFRRLMLYVSKVLSLFSPQGLVWAEIDRRNLLLHWWRRWSVLEVDVMPAPQKIKTLLLLMFWCITVVCLVALLFLGCCEPKVAKRKKDNKKSKKMKEGENNNGFVCHSSNWIFGTCLVSVLVWEVWARVGCWLYLPPRWKFSISIDSSFWSVRTFTSVDLVESLSCR